MEKENNDILEEDVTESEALFGYDDEDMEELEDSVDTKDDPEDEPEENNKKPIFKIILIVLFCAALLAAMVLLVLKGSGMLPEKKPATTDPVNTATNSYTVSKEEATQKMDVVVATAGDAQLTNGELQVYYWMCIYDFISQNSYLLSYYGVDFSQPLDQQIADPSTGETWQEVMLEYALNTWHQYNSLSLYAKQQGYTLDEDGQAYMDGLDESIQEMLTMYNYGSLRDMLDTEMGYGASEQGYKNYLIDGYYAMDYATYLQDNTKPSLTELEAYYNSNATAYIQQGVTMDTGDVVDARHILLIPEGGTTDEQGNTTYSDAEWEACRVKAQQLLDDWVAAGADEDSFADLAAQHSQDTYSAAYGGMCSGMAPGETVENFDAWIFADDRAYGDYALVQTEFGYHIIFFVVRQPSWAYTVSNDYIYEKVNDIILASQALFPLEVDYDAVILGEITY